MRKRQQGQTKKTHTHTHIITLTHTVIQFRPCSDSECEVRHHPLVTGGGGWAV